MDLSVVGWRFLWFGIATAIIIFLQFFRGERFGYMESAAVVFRIDESYISLSDGSSGRRRRLAWTA